MSKSPTTYISFLLDRTGSMSVVRDATISGFNEFLNSQRQLPGKTRWTLTLFDRHESDPTTQMVFENVKGRDVPDLTYETYVPRGMTPLYDAVGQTLTAAIEHTKANAYDNHIFVIMTDGQENASQEWTVERVRELIKTVEEDNWQVIFLGANQDAWETGQYLGSTQGSYTTYSNTNVSVGAAMAAASMDSAQYRTTGMQVNTVRNVVDPANSTEQALGKTKTVVNLEGKAHGKSGTKPKS